MISIVVFFKQFGTLVQVMLALGLVYMSYVFHIYARPYHKLSKNQLEALHNEEVVEQASRPKKQRKLSKKDRKMAEKKTREQRAAEKKAKRKPRRPKSAKDGDADAGEDHIEPMNWSDGE